MNRRLSIFVILTLTLVGCKESTVSPPEQYLVSVHLQTGYFFDSVVVAVDDNITFKVSVSTKPDSGFARAFSLGLHEGNEVESKAVFHSFLVNPVFCFIICGVEFYFLS